MFSKTIFVVLVILSVLHELVFGYDCIKRPKVRYPFCQDRNEARRGHTMCLGTIHQHLMNDTEYEETFLIMYSEAQLNKYARGCKNKRKPPAADMIKLEHNQLLEKEAQIWAEQCKLTHDKEELRFLADRFTVGQNIAVGGPVLNWTQVLEQWENEKAALTYGGSNTVSAIANYAQMIWAKTYMFGCGVSKCGSKYFYVCNYAPSMNESEISTPYMASASGTWCDSCKSRCDNVTSKQCDCWGKLCLNGGQINLTTCKCDCITAVNTYDPAYCALICNTGGDDPACGKPPYENSTCGISSLTDFHCPWMCDICPYAGVNYTESSVLLPWERGLPMCTTSTSSTTTRSTTNTGVSMTTVPTTTVSMTTVPTTTVSMTTVPTTTVPSTTVSMTTVPTTTVSMTTVPTTTVSTTVPLTTVSMTTVSMTTKLNTKSVHRNSASTHVMLCHLYLIIISYGLISIR